MHSDQDRIYSSEDSENKDKKPPQYGEEKTKKDMPEYYDIKHPSMLYYHGMPGHPTHMIMHRPNSDPMLARTHSRPTSPRGASPEVSDFNYAMGFLNRIQEEYSDALPVYDSFLETMRDFKFGKIDADEVCKAVRILFKDKPFLIRFFDEYLPPYLRQNNDNRQFEQHREPKKMPIFRPPPTHPAYFKKLHMPMNRMMPQQTMAHINRPIHHLNPNPGVYIPNPPMARPSMAEESPVVKPRPSTPQEINSSKRDDALAFIKLVKKRFETRPMIYNQFVQLLHKESNGFDNLLKEISSLLADFPDLIESFEKKFRPENLNETIVPKQHHDPLKSTKDVLASKNLLENFLKIINFYNQNFINSNDLIFLLEPIIDDAEQMIAFKQFIKYEDNRELDDSKKLKECPKIGSYKIFTTPFQINTSNTLFKEVLNNICVSVSTHESEEDTYVFRNKNSYEELLMKVGDERSESDLVLDRIKYLIQKLEELYENLETDHIDLDDIQMSTALVKETLKKIYESRSNEILETILTQPKRSIPVVLRRLYKVYKENLLKHRQHRKAWRAIVNECYYKAYDTRGVVFKSNEKLNLSLKAIHDESVNPITILLNDFDILDFIKEIITLFIVHNNSISIKKHDEQKINKFVNEIFLNLKQESFGLLVNFDQYALYRFISTLFERYNDIKEMEFEPLTSNQMAVDINIQEEQSVIDRYNEVKRAAVDLVTKEIDTEEYEEKVRILTDNKGYKLYNLKNIMIKIDNQILAMMDQTVEFDDSQDSYMIEKKNSYLMMRLFNSKGASESIANENDDE